MSKITDRNDPYYWIRQYALAQCDPPKGLSLKVALQILNDLRARHGIYGRLFKAPLWFLEDLVGACRKQYYIDNSKKNK